MERAVVARSEAVRELRTNSHKPMVPPPLTAEARRQICAHASGGTTVSLTDPVSVLGHRGRYPMELPSEFGVAAAQAPHVSTAKATQGAGSGTRARTMERNLSSMLQGYHHLPSRTEQDIAPRELTAAAVVGLDGQSGGPRPPEVIHHWVPAPPGHRGQAGPEGSYAQAMRAGGGRATRGFRADLPASTDAVTNSNTTGREEQSEWAMVSRASS